MVLGGCSWVESDKGELHQDVALHHGNRDVCGLAAPIRITLNIALNHQHALNATLSFFSSAALPRAIDFI